jgi:acetoin utilization protein AcuA
VGRLLTCLETDRSRGTSLGSTAILQTAKGPVTIRTRCCPGSFVHLSMDAGLGHFPQYSSIIRKWESLDAIASSEGGRVTLALAESVLVVGYLTCWHPSDQDRWGSLGKLLYELAAIEVSRNYRRMGIARRMLEITLDDDFFADKIAFAKGLSWHWDFGATGLKAQPYRRMLIALCEGLGFREVHTNEPGIGLCVENFMLARIGPSVSPEDRKRFRFLRFGITYPA